MSAPEHVAGLAGPDEPSPSAPPTGTRRPPLGLGRELLFVLGTATVGGVLVGVLWVLLAPVAVRHSAVNEAQIADDAVLGLLGMLAGLVTATVLILRPGRHPAIRAALALSAVTAASFLAWGLGRLLGGPVLHAVGMVLLWPLVAAALTALRSLIGMLFTAS